MLKNIFKLRLLNMNNEKNLKQTLAKKLSGKKRPVKLEQKAEEAETKSHLFNQLNTKEKSNNNNVLKMNSKAVKPVSGKTEINKNDTTETVTQRSTRSRKVEPVDSLSSLEVANVIKVKQTTKNTDKKKAPIDAEEPCTSKTIKEELKREKLDDLNVKPEIVTKATTKKKSTNAEEPCSSKKIKATDWEPANWQLVLENIRIMRSADKAPVDTMGCHKCADENADEKTQRFHKLVALMLSSQTKDETTYHAMLRLREHTLTPEVICDMKVNVLENILHPVSFYKNKAKYLQQTSKILLEKYDSDIPNNIKELVALPGVGPKMAHICMATAWQEVTGIGVDVHVHRISNRLGWLPKPTKEPEQTRLALEAWLPQHLWSDVNYLLVGFGQTVCTPVRPKCKECLNCSICPSAPKTEKKVQNSKVLELCDTVKFKKSKIHL